MRLQLLPSLLVFAAALTHGACSSHAPAPAAAEREDVTPGPSEPPGDPAGDPPSAPAEPSWLPSSLGRWELRWRSQPDPFEFNDPVRLLVEVRASSGRELPPDLDLRVDAGMPQHGHGMNRVPSVRRVGAGQFEVDGVLMHMPGRWQLYFDVGSRGRWERVQLALEID